MFESLSERLQHVFKRFSGKTRIRESDIKDILKEIRKSLLEADVALSVVKDFVHSVQEKSIGQQIEAHLSSEQSFLKIVHEELVALMGSTHEPLRLKAEPPVVLLMAGLQGSGKTTTSAKLASHIQTELKRRVALTSVDTYRPAAREQLAVLAEQIQVPFLGVREQDDPLMIAKEALLQARKQQLEVLIVDTAGRLHVDERMMSEIKALHHQLNPTEILFVVDSMTGQDAIHTAKAFSDALPLTGVVLTKLDGDTRGGAALSIRQVTGKPIKFIGVGEKVDALEVFHPQRLASRILGMGDLLSLIEEMDKKVDKEKAEKLSQKLQKGQGFDLNDLREQMQQMLNMGGMANLIDKLPGANQLTAALKDKNPDQEVRKTLAVLDSMTPHERFFPDKISHSGSRKRRIALGAGTDIQAVNRVLKQHEKMAKMMKKVSSKGGMARLLQGLPGRGIHV